VTGPDRWDAYRLEPMSDTWLALYTLSSADNVSPLVINNLPMLSDDMIDVPLYCKAQINDGTTGDYTLQWELPENWPTGWKISLQDHRREQVCSMTENSTFELGTSTGTTLSTKLDKLPMPLKLVDGYADTSLLRSTGSLPPYSIVISRNSEIEYMAAVPELLGNFPNPFQKESFIRFSLPKKANVLVEVLTLQGKKIATLADGKYIAGITEVRWNAKNNAPGMYLIRFESGDTVVTKKAILIP